MAAHDHEADFREIAIVLRIEATRAARDLQLLDELVAGLEGGPFPGTLDAHRRLKRETVVLRKVADLFALLIPHEEQVLELAAIIR